MRATAETCGKLVDFRIEGEHVALDKSLLEQMADPLLHLLRNAVDHGIESPERRQAADKPERGTITVRAFHEGTDVLIEVEDDGTGLDLDRIRRTAIAKGFMTEATVMSTDALFALIFEPGFSTAESGQRNLRARRRAWTSSSRRSDGWAGACTSRRDRAPARRSRCASR